MKKKLLALAVILCVFAAVFTVIYRNYERFYGETTYYNICNKTATFNEIFYNYVDPSNIVYTSHDGNDSQPAEHLAEILSRCNYIPLNKKEGRTIVFKESKKTFIVMISNKTLLYSQENPMYFIFDIRCILVNDKLYLIVEGKVKDTILNPKDIKNAETSEMRNIISVYECEETKDIYYEVIKYKKEIKDKYYIPYHSIGTTALKYYISHISAWDLKDKAIIAIPILVSISFLVFVIKKQRSNADKYVEDDDGHRPEKDSDLPEDKDQT